MLLLWRIPLRVLLLLLLSCPLHLLHAGRFGFLMCVALCLQQCVLLLLLLLQPVSSREALCLPGIERTLLSDADLRVRGFGLPDGLSSLAGDLAEKPPPAAVVAAAAAASAGPEAEAEAAAAASSSSSLVGRFNKHSQRLLLQQLLQPAAAAAAINDEAGHEQKLHLLLQQEEHQRKRRSVRPEPAGAVLQANLKDAATSKH